MRVVIVDDEPLARVGVQARLAQFPDVQIVGECDTGKEAVTLIHDLKPDLVFLDIQMPDLNGFEVLQKLPSDKLPFVVFLTAHDQYALAAFEVRAIDYLLKPIDDARFTRALEHARTQMKTVFLPGVECRLRELLEQIEAKEVRPRYQARFAVRTGRRIALVSVEDIDWIKAAGDYATLHIGTRSYLLRQTMTRLEHQLDPERFIRVHRSAIVNASRISELESLPNREYLLRLTTGVRLRTSRRFSDRLEHWI